MNLNENIHNAVVVIKKTYENIDKLIKYCQTISERDTDYITSVSKFLRYKSDNNCSGWMVANFILLFQNKQDRKLKNGWRNGEVFVMEINLEDEEIPTVFLSKFEYENISSWSAGCSPASYGVFYKPIRNNNMEHVKSSDITITTPKTLMDQKIAKDFWGLKRVITVRMPLTELAADNVKDKVFGSFDRLRDM